MIDISVIVPVYNTKQYLDTCVESLLNQTLKNIEIILVDDESPDGAGERCDFYARNYTNITVVHKKNGGLGEARNTGCDIARGKYVAFLDSDDYVAPDFYYNLLESCEKNDLDICTSKGYFQFYNANPNSVKACTYFSEYPILENEQIKKLIPRFIGRNPQGESALWNSSCASLYKRELIHNIRFISERTFASEDLWFNMDTYSHAKRVGFVDVIGYYYRYNPESLSRKYSKDRFDALNKSILLLDEKCKDLELTNYQDHVAMYYYTVFEVCVNHEIRFVKGQKGRENILKMVNHPLSREYLSILAENPSFHGLHAFLCKLLYNKKVYIIGALLTIYNFFSHSIRNS